MISIVNGLGNLPWNEARLFVQNVLLPASQKAIEIGLHYFGFVKQSYCCGVGLQHFLKGAQRLDVDKESSQPLPFLGQRVHRYSLEWFKQQWKKSKEHIVHGGLYMGAGVFGTTAALHRLKKVEIGRAYHFVNTTGTGLFLFANLLVMQKIIQQYHGAREIILKGAPPEQVEAAKRALDSAILGITSSLGYIVVSLISLLGGWATCALIFGCIATTTGFLKVIYDYYYTVVDVDQQSPASV